MKKSLLLACLCGAVSVNALGFEAPVTYPDASWQGISPNGRYVVSNLNGSLTIMDRVEGTDYTYQEEGARSYMIGMGNIVSNTGIVLCSNNISYNTSYWENGEWKETPVLNPNLTNSLNGVTPDGKRFAGNLGAAELSLEAETTMQLPAYWDRNEDGTYELHTLPHPEKDFLGRTPQYITATNISDDGKVIVGQIEDYSGGFQQPIAYIEGEDGEWTYKLLLTDFFTVEGEMPEDPGDGPWPPEITSFLSDESRAEYEKAYDEWVASQYQLDYPNPENYLSEEEKAAYDAAMAEYNEEYAKWEEKFDTYSEFIEELRETIPAFVFNDTEITPDGKTVSQTQEVSDDSDPFAWPRKVNNTPWLINIDTDQVQKLEYGKSMAVTRILSDGTVLAYNGVYAVPSEGYIIKNDQCQDVYDYLTKLSPEMSTWCEENLQHEMEEYDWETDEFIYTTYKFTGRPLASDDMSVLAIWVVNSWDYAVDDQTYGYLFDINSLSSIGSVEAAKSHIGFDAAGNLNVSDDFTSVSVYDLSGRLLSPNGANASKLASGIYIVRAQRNDGTAVSAKLRK